MPSGKKSAAWPKLAGSSLVEARAAAVRVDRVPAVERALGFGVERADRLDLVAEELDADRVGRIGREDVEDAAADAELAGDLDDLGPRHPALEQPAGQAPRRARRRRRSTPRDIRRQGFGRRAPAGSIAWNGATTRRGGFGPGKLLEHPQPPAEDLVGGVQLARQLFPGGEDLGRDPGEDRHVVAEIVDVADVGQHDHQRRGCMQPEGRDDRAAAEPQAPSIVALRPFFNAARSSGNPGGCAGSAS